jgi:hypothetical protein
MHLTEVKRRRHGNYVTPAESRRQCSVYYTVPDGKGDILNVCRATFADIFSVSQKKVYTLTLKKKNGQTTCEEKRGNKKKNRKYTIDDEIKIKAHVNSFPKEESHYGRSRSQKEYLSPDLNKHRLFLAYKIVEPMTKVSYKYYCSVFKNCFPNLRFGCKRSDTCSTCDLLSAQVKADPANQTNHIKLELHQRKAESAMNAMKADVASSQMPASDICTASMDLQQVLLTPTLTHSQMYYARQLSNFNLGIHIADTKEAFMCMWHEGLTGRGGNEIASCIYKLFSSHTQNTYKNKLIMWSDNCSGQNKNKMIIFLWIYLVAKGIFSCIEHKFLISGHSFLSCDRDFALIEKRKRVTQTMVPEDLQVMIKTARNKQPFHVVRMEKEDFLDFKEAANEFIITKNLKISQGHCVKIDSEDPAIVKIKETHSPLESWKPINILKRNKTINQLQNFVIPRLHCVSKISEEKKKDLLGMLPYLHNEEHKLFYQTLLE